MYEIKHYSKEEKKDSSKLQNLSRGLILIFLVLFTLNVLVSSYLGKSLKNDSLFVSPLATVKKVIEKTSSLIRSQENSKPIEQIVKNVLKNSSEYSVFIKNLKTGERYYLNENKQYETASLYKLWIMAVAYKQIEDGVLKRDQVLEGNVSDLNNKFNIASESAELTDGSVSMTVEEGLKNMITVSDNYSALLLTNKIKLSNITLFLNSEGFLESKVGTSDGNPVSSAKDMGLFLEKLYNGDFANEEHTNEMLIFLKNQQINTKLSKYLPESAVIANKTGELDNFSHDAGIVFVDNNDYVIVVMSKTDVVPDANENIANISKQIYGYFTK